MKQPQMANSPSADAAHELYGRVFALAEAGQYADAVDLCDELLAYCRTHDEPEVRVIEARTLVAKGVSLEDLGRGEDALAAFSSVVEEFGGESSPAFQRQVARALGNAGYALNELGRYEEALVVLDDLLARFADEGDTGLREQVAVALFNKAYALQKLERLQESIAVCEALLDRIENTDAIERIVNTFLCKGNLLYHVGRRAEAFDAWREVIERASAAPGTPMRAQHATALFNLTAGFDHLGATVAAHDGYTKVIETFRDDPEPEVAGIVERAEQRRSELRGQ